jgi:hypothetical protein
MVVFNWHAWTFQMTIWYHCPQFNNNTYTLYTHCVCTTVCMMSSQLEKPYHYETQKSCWVSWKNRITTRREASSSDTASSSNTAFPTDKTWYKQLYIHFVYIIRLSNIFMIKHKKKSCKFHWIYYLKKSKQRGTIVYVTRIVTSRHSNNSKIWVRWNFPDGDSAMFTKTSLGFSRIPNIWRHESSSD